MGNRHNATNNPSQLLSTNHNKAPPKEKGNKTSFSNRFSSSSKEEDKYSQYKELPFIRESPNTTIIFKKLCNLTLPKDEVKRCCYIPEENLLVLLLGDT